MSTTRKVQRPAKADVISGREAAQLAAEWSDADGARLALERDAAKLKKRQEEIAKHLLPFVDAHKTGKLRSVTLPKKARLEIVAQPPHAVTVAFAAQRELVTDRGREILELLAAEIGPKDKLVVDDLRPEVQTKGAA